MNYREPPSWVKGQAECRLEFRFETLKQAVKRDIDEFNALSPERSGHRNFELVEEDDKDEAILPQFVVNRVLPPQDWSHARFRLGPTSVDITFGDPGSRKYLHLISVWDEKELTCKWHERDKEDESRLYEAWEISRMVLSEAFFGYD